MFTSALVALAMGQAAPGPSVQEPSQAPDDAVAGAYVSRCSGCHTIGGGPLKGPDLAASTQWPRASLRLAVAKMDKNTGPMTDAEVDAFTDLLLAPDVRPRLEAARAAAAKNLQASLEPPSEATGEELFSGRLGLSGGGPSCAACHRVAGSGGALGPDLTHLAGKMDEVAMVSAFQGANFPIMRAAYAGRAITPQEAVHLAAYVRGAKGKDSDRGSHAVFAAGAALGLVGFFGLAALLRPHRRTGATPYASTAGARR